MNGDGGPLEASGTRWVRAAAFGVACTCAGLAVGGVVVLDTVQGGGAIGAGVGLVAALSLALAAGATALETGHLSISWVRRTALGVGVAVALVYGGLGIGTVLQAGAGSLPGACEQSGGRPE